MTEIWDFILFLFFRQGSLLLTIVGLGGLYLCHKYREKMPGVSRRVTIASIFLLIRSILFPMAVYFVPVALTFPGDHMLYGVFYLLLEAIAFWLLLSVAFRDE